MSQKRESLKLIQPSDEDHIALRGNSKQSLQKKRSLSESEVVKKSKVTTRGAFTVYEDTKKSVEIQTEWTVAHGIKAEDLTSEEVNPDYWKEQAETLRCQVSELKVRVRELESEQEKPKKLRREDEKLAETAKRECSDWKEQAETLHCQVSELKVRVHELESEEKHEELKREAEKLAETVKRLPKRVLAEYFDDDDNNNENGSDNEEGYNTSHGDIPDPVNDLNSSESSLDTKDNSGKSVDAPPSDDIHSLPSSHEDQQISEISEISGISDFESTISCDIDQQVLDGTLNSVSVLTKLGDPETVANLSDQSISSSPLLPTTISTCQSSVEEALPTVLEDFSSSPENERGSPRNDTPSHSESD